MQVESVASVTLLSGKSVALLGPTDVSGVTGAGRTTRIRSRLFETTLNTKIKLNAQPELLKDNRNL